VNQFLGDGIMALFGAPIALEDHALRAVRAALAIQETISGYSARSSKTRAAWNFGLRLGLNTGPVVVGRIGDDLRMDYTAVGDHDARRSSPSIVGRTGCNSDQRGDPSTRACYIRSEPSGNGTGERREAGSIGLQGERAAGVSAVVWT
jgi:hypothetical protein